MEYHGKLYGKLLKNYFDTGHTTEDWDNLKNRIKELESELKKVNCAQQPVSTRLTGSIDWIKRDSEKLQAGTKVLGALQHWKTKNYRYFEVIKVEEDDCDFRTVDDNSEISYDWTITHYASIQQPS